MDQRLADLESPEPPHAWILKGNANNITTDATSPLIVFFNETEPGVVAGSVAFGPGRLNGDGPIIGTRDKNHVAFVSDGRSRIYWFGTLSGSGFAGTYWAGDQEGTFDLAQLP